MLERQCQFTGCLIHSKWNYNDQEFPLPHVIGCLPDIITCNEIIQGFPLWFRILQASKNLSWESLGMRLPHSWNGSLGMRLPHSQNGSLGMRHKMRLGMRHDLGILFWQLILFYETFTKSINQSTNQSIDQLINWSTNQPINQSINWSIYWSTNNQLINQSINQLVNQ